MRDLTQINKELQAKLKTLKIDMRARETMWWDELKEIRQTKLKCEETLVHTMDDAKWTQDTYLKQMDILWDKQHDTMIELEEEKKKATCLADMADAEIQKSIHEDEFWREVDKELLRRSL